MCMYEAHIQSLSIHISCSILSAIIYTRLIISALRPIHCPHKIFLRAIRNASKWILVFLLLTSRHSFSDFFHFMIDARALPKKYFFSLFFVISSSFHFLLFLMMKQWNQINEIYMHTAKFLCVLWWMPQSEYVKEGGKEKQFLMICVQNSNIFFGP